MYSLPTSACTSFCFLFHIPHCTLDEKFPNASNNFAYPLITPSTFVIPRVIPALDFMQVLHFSVQDPEKNSYFDPRSRSKGELHLSCVD